VINNNSTLDNCGRLATVKPEEEWWFYQCAGTPVDATGKLVEVDIRNLLSHIQKVFDNKWYIRWGNIRNKGICANLMIGGAQNTTGNIVRLASNIQRLGGIDRLPYAKENLRNVAKCLATILELEVLGCFAEQGLPVTPYPVLESGAMPEARVTVDGTEVYVEVTHMEWPRREELVVTDWKSKQGAKLADKCIEKVSQLPNSECCVVVINPPTLIDNEIGRSIMASLAGYLSPDLYTRISGIILANKFMERSGFIKTCPVVVVNSLASKRCDDALVRLADALGKYPEY